MAEAKALTLTEFLAARIDEDETVAHHAIEALASRNATGVQLYGRKVYDPGRVLAEVEAKRGILHLWDADDYTNDEGEILGGAGPETHHEALCLLTLPYADHPDYRQEWMP